MCQEPVKGDFAIVLLHFALVLIVVFLQGVRPFGDVWNQPPYEVPPLEFPVSRIWHPPGSRLSGSSRPLGFGPFDCEATMLGPSALSSTSCESTSTSPGRCFRPPRTTCRWPSASCGASGYGHPESSPSQSCAQCHRPKCSACRSPTVMVVYGPASPSGCDRDRRTRRSDAHGRTPRPNRQSPRRRVALPRLLPRQDVFV